MTETKCNTNVPKEIVDECRIKCDHAYHEIDTLAVFIDLQLNSITMKIQKLNGIEYYQYAVD